MAFRLFGMFFMANVVIEISVRNSPSFPCFSCFLPLFIAENHFFSIVYTDIVKFYLHLHTFSATSVE